MAPKTTAPASRAAVLTAERNRKMAASAHAYVRGSTTAFLRMARHGNRLACAARASDLDLRRLPRRQSRPRRQHGWQARHPDTRPRPDDHRQPRPRPHPARPLARHGRARLRPARGHHRAHARTHDGGLRSSVCAEGTERDTGRRSRHAAHGAAGDEGCSRTLLEAPGRRAHRGGGSGDPARPPLLAADGAGTRSRSSR